MADIRCPHCGASNFAISAYCKRCERPLHTGDVTRIERMDRIVEAVEPDTDPSLPPDSYREADTVIDRRGLIPTPERSLEPPPPAQRTPAPESRPPEKILNQPRPHVIGQAPPASSSSATSQTGPRAARRSTSERPARSRPTQDEPLVVAPASKWRVLIALLVDGLLALGVGVAWVAGEVALRDQPFATVFWDPIDVASEWIFIHFDTLMRGVIATLLTATLFGLLPQARTVGRRVAGIVLVRSSGKPFSIWVSILRGVGVLVSAASFGLGALWALFDPHARAWHDVLAGTISVPRRLSLRSSATPRIRG